MGEILRGKKFGIEFQIFVQVLPPDPLAVDFVALVELQAGLSLEAGHGHNCLGSQGPPINQEEDPFSEAGLHQPIDQIDDSESLARARGHGQHHVSASVHDGPLHGLDRFRLIEPQALMDDRDRVFSKPFSGSGLVFPKQFHKCLGSVEGSDFAGKIQWVPQVLKPDDCPIA